MVCIQIFIPVFRFSFLSYHKMNKYFTGKILWPEISQFPFYLIFNFFKRDIYQTCYELDYWMCIRTAVQSRQVGDNHPLWIGYKCACAIMSRVYSWMRHWECILEIPGVDVYDLINRHKHKILMLLSNLIIDFNCTFNKNRLTFGLL